MSGQRKSLRLQHKNTPALTLSPRASDSRASRSPVMFDSSSSPTPASNAAPSTSPSPDNTDPHTQEITSRIVADATEIPSDPAFAVQRDSRRSPPPNSLDAPPPDSSAVGEAVKENKHTMVPKYRLAGRP